MSFDDVGLRHPRVRAEIPVDVERLEALIRRPRKWSPTTATPSSSFSTAMTPLTRIAALSSDLQQLATENRAHRDAGDFHARAP